MAGSVKFFCLAASILLLLQSIDGSVLGRKSSKKQRENTSAQSDENATDNYGNSNTNGKGQSTPILKYIKKTGSNIVQMENNLPQLVMEKVKNAKDEIVREKNELSKKDSNKNANILQRNISIPAKAVNNVGIEYFANKTEKYVKKFQNEFNNRDKLTPVEEREDTISANLKRYMHNPVIVSKAITGVAVDKIKSIKSSLLKGNNDV